MLVYRLVKSKFARDLSGEGARLFGGRWNEPGTPCIYTAGSRALAVLEYTVNVNVSEIPQSLRITTFEIPDEAILDISLSYLPYNWNDLPASFASKNFGTKLLKENKYLGFKLPSVVVPQEFNYLLNPVHTQAANIRIVSVEEFVYDLRIKR